MSRLRAADNPAYQSLLAEAGDAGLPTDTVRDLLWSINADPDLTAFATIAQNLSHILSSIPQQMGISLASAGLAGWDVAVDWLVSETPRLVSTIGARFSRVPKNPTDNPLLNRSISRYPLYGALWNTHECPELRPRFRALQAQVLIAHASLMRQHTSLAQYESHDGDDSVLRPPYGAQPAGLALRRLSHMRSKVELCALDPFQPPETFAKSLRGYRIRLDEQQASVLDVSQERLQAQVLAVVFFLEKTYGLRPWRSRDGGGGGDSGAGDPGYVEYQQQYDVDDGCGEEGPLSVSLQFEPEHTQRIEQLLRDDCSPYDDGSEIIDVLVPSDSHSGGRPAALSALGDRGRARHIALINQCLPFHYNVLTCDEIHDVYRGLLALFDELVQTRSNQEVAKQLDTILIALVVLWTGNSFERAASLRVCVDKRPRRELVLQLGSGEETGHWWIHSEFPRYKTELAVTEESVRPRTSFVPLPDVAGIGALIEQVMEKRGQKVSPRTRLFRHSPAEYRRTFRGMLKTTRGAGRVTPAMWEKVLFQRIVDQTGDVTDGVALTGVPHALANTKSYYCTPSLRALIATYLRVTRTLVSQCELDVVFDFDTYSIPDTANELHVGSRACARRDAVISQVSDLKKRVRARSDYLSWSDFVEYHNLYTFYTVQMLGFATGLRAITRPYLDAAVVDQILSIAAISDKDSVDRRRSRLGYIPDAVVVQLHYYEQHCAIVRAEEERRILGNKASAPVPCYLLRSGRPGTDEVRPGNLGPYLNDFLGLPANAHRRFMRTELKERGCHPDFINAFMGHASFGEEPWGRYSSLSVEWYREMMKRYLVPLLTSLGWQPLRSLLVPGVSYG